MRRLIVILMFWGPIPLTFFDPYIGVLSYTLMNIIRPEQLMWGDRHAAGRIFLVTQFVCFTSWLINKNNEKLTPEDTPLSFQNKLILILAINMTIVTWTATNYDLSWRWTSGFWKVSLFCFVITKAINSAQKMELYYAIALIWLTLLAIWGIQQKLGGNVRMEGLGGDQLKDINDISAVYVLFFPMTYYSLFSTKKWIRLFVGIPSSVIFIGFIFFGGSRGAFLGIAGCMVLIFLRGNVAQKAKMMLVSVVVGGFLMLFLSIFAPEGFLDSYKARLATIFGQEDETTGEVQHEGSSAGRISMWKGALVVFAKTPEYWFKGVGMRCYPSMYFKHFDIIEPALEPEEFGRIYGGGRGGKAIHNTQINVLMSGGLPLTFFWILLIVFSWFQAHSIPRRYPKIVDGVNIHNYAMALEIGIVGWSICMTFLNLELVDFFYWHLTMAGVLTNIGKAKLKREAFEMEDEEFIESKLTKTAYA